MVKIAVTTQAKISIVGVPNSVSIPADTIKIPEPIMLPIMSIMLSNKLSFLFIYNLLIEKSTVNYK